MLSLSLEAKNISKAFEAGVLFKRKNIVLDNVSFEVKLGVTLGVMGESGAGKTTLAKILVGLEVPSSGAVCFYGRNIQGMGKKEISTFRRKVQMVFQNPESSLNPRKTIEKSLLEVLGLLNIAKEKQFGILQQTLQAVGLSRELLYRFPSQLSGGQNQRIVLARALLLGPEILILDEPFSELDISVRAQMLHLLKELQNKKKLGYVFISHDLDSLKFMSDRIGIIENCRLRFDLNYS